MSNPSQTLTKTCSICGLPKPLSAFLLMTKEGTVYGNICSSCRKAQQEKVAPKESDERTRRETGGSKIRASERKEIEALKKQEHDRLENLYEKENEKDEKQLTEKTQQIETRAKDEKKHREYKRSFLDSRTKIKEAKGAPTFNERVAGEAEINLASGPFLDTEIAGKVKYEQSSIFQQFKKWLGNNAPIVSAAEKQVAEKVAGAPEKAAGTPDVSEKPEEMIKQTWGPNSRRR